jgi:hypothetical protein
MRERGKKTEEKKRVVMKEGRRGEKGKRKGREVMKWRYAMTSSSLILIDLLCCPSHSILVLFSSMSSNNNTFPSFRSECNRDNNLSLM